MVATVRLTQGYEAIVSSRDLPLVNNHSWHAARRKHGVYAMASIKGDGGKFSGLLLHRLVMGAKPGQIVDHVNGNTLDNRRENLRFATAQQNGANKRGHSQHGYTGLRKSGGSWVAVIAPDGRDIALGTYATREAAAAAYNAAARAIFGEFARLNPVPFDQGLISQILRAKREAIARLEQEITILGGSE